MNKFILLLTFTTCLFASAYSQFQWQNISNLLPDFPYDTTIVNNGSDTVHTILYDIFFVDNQEAWVTTYHAFEDSAAILHTTDACRTFEVQMVIRPAKAIYMLDKNIGYCGGESSILNKTTDGGKHWNIHATLGVWEISDIDFPPGSEIGFCCGSPEKVARITPDGIEFVPTETPAGLDLQSICFPFENEGWLGAEANIMHYHGDSNEFMHDQSYQNDNIMNSIFFIDETHKGWCASGAAVHRTEDGISWQRIPMPGDMVNQAMEDVFFLNENIGWVVGTHGSIAKTTDGGKTWIQQAEGLTDQTLISVFAIDEDHVYVTGMKNTLLMYGEPLGIRDFDVDPDFIIYPNPAGSVFSLQSEVFSQKSSTIEIYDLNGRKLLKKLFPAGNETIEVDVSGLQSGFYFCSLTSENRSTTQKLIIQK